MYWLRLLAESRILSNERLNSIIQERDELVAIITAIIVKIKRQPEGRRSEE